VLVNAADFRQSTTTGCPPDFARVLTSPMPRTPVTIRFSEECWRFLREHHAEVAPDALSSEVRGMIDRPSKIVGGHLPVYAVQVLRMHAHELLEYLAALHDALSPIDPRRRLSERCLDDIDAAIKRSGAT
jgi:hypothetical protein